MVRWRPGGHRDLVASVPWLCVSGFRRVCSEQRRPVQPDQAAVIGQEGRRKNWSNAALARVPVRRPPSGSRSRTRGDLSALRPEQDGLSKLVI